MSFSRPRNIVSKSSRHPVLLMILDGFGEAKPADDNAITRAEPKFYYKMRDRGLLGFLDASGTCVGLPEGQMGNSEVGHLSIGAGRTVRQDLTRINLSIDKGEFQKKPALVAAFDRVGTGGGRVHLLGLVSDGGVHSSDRHLAAILQELGRRELGARTRIHALLDGRDTPPRSALVYLEELEKEAAKVGARIATVTGRYWAMDRDKRWERVEKAWRAICLGQGLTAELASAAVQAAYERGENDEFVSPTVIGEACRIEDGDLVFFFNFRADRARQISEAFLLDDFAAFDRVHHPAVAFLSMTRYRADFPCPVLFDKPKFQNLFPEIVSLAGMRQLRIAETEKYAHVTFFFGGGREEIYPGEERILVPSPKVATYDLKPEMSALIVAEKLVTTLQKESFDLIVLNFANGDMVGHTGNLDASIEAVRTLDRCLEMIVPTFVKMGGVVALTADHGNCEQMSDPVTGGPFTAHTTNPVHFLLYGDAVAGLHRVREGGTLADIAPSLLPFMGLELPAEMEGRNLLE